MAEKSYEELIFEILYVDGRVSKAKAIGVVVGLLVFIAYMAFLIPQSLRMGVLTFLITIIFCFFHIVLYYGICRGAGYLIRRFLIK